MKITFLWLLSILIMSARLGAVTANQAADRDLANQIWGNPQNWAQPAGSHPNASYFDHPIPIGMGARALGMGEAFTAVADDISAIWWNPAGLIHMPHNEVTWMGGDRVMNAYPFTGFFAASYMLENRMVFALSLQRPYHPVGRYPDLLAGDYPFSTDRWSGTGPVTIPGPPGSTVPFSNITDSKVQDFLKNAYRLWINVPFQENIYTFTYATPLSPDRNLAFGFNVKYLTQDSGFTADGVALDTVGGWGADLGFHYQIPMARYGRVLSFGLNVRDLASQIRGDNNREITLPSVASLGVAYRTQDIFAGSTMNLAADINYINDPAIEFSHNHRLNVGGEMTFFDGHIAPRLGYTLFFDQPSRATLGIGFNYLIGLDYAYHLPALNEEASHWFSATIRWGGPREIKPLPEVSVSAEPPIFSPKAGELATFSISADSKFGIDRWALSIFDHNNQAVKTYQDRGTPPSQILWGGEDKVYRLLPDGEYTYLLTATDNMGTSNTSPLQTLHLYTTPPKQVERQDVDNLRKLIKKQEETEEAEEDAVAKGLRSDLAMLIKKKSVNQTLPALAATPEPAPKPLTGSAGTMLPGMTAAQAYSYPTLNDYPFPKMGFTTMPNGQRSYQVEYETSQTMPRYIFSDMLDMVRVTAKDVGEAVPQYEYKAHYGNKLFRMVTSSSSAMSLSRGFINQNQFFRNAAVTLDGEPINPSF